MSPLVTGRRNARWASVVRIVRAQAGSCARLRRTADEDRLAARRLAARGRTVGTADDQLADIRRGRLDVEPLDARAAQAQVDRRRHRRRTAATPGRAALSLRRLALPLQVLARRRHADGMQARLDRKAHLIRIDLDFFTLGLHAEEADLEDVLRVERKVVRHGDAGARVERQLVVQLLVAAPLFGSRFAS